MPVEINEETTNRIGKNWNAISNLLEGNSYRVQTPKDVHAIDTAGKWVRGTSTLPKELQDVGDKEWLWDNIKDKWELDETRKEPTLGLISEDEFKNKKSKWKRNFYTRYAT
ncbi:hypothetical protein IFM89_000134 [Coptis chinensis]|uniref:Uncharacterized protein n=1 Tax=Coptis chinensis TaxID=261450 RepID=A0A835H589_9MAGN|nr:hypothetical protein IFM89_000134 [Coptis chinensis]